LAFLLERAPNAVSQVASDRRHHSAAATGWGYRSTSIPSRRVSSVSSSPSRHGRSRADYWSSASSNGYARTGQIAGAWSYRWAFVG